MSVLTEVKEKGAALRFAFPDGHHTFGIHCWSNLPEILIQFKTLCQKKFFSGANKGKFNAFWQGDQDDWIFVEFWTNETAEEQDMLLQACEELAAEMGFDLKVD